jgi:hypothetical protein
MRQVALFYNFANLFNVWLTRDNWIPIPAFPHIVLMKVYEEYE